MAQAHYQEFHALESKAGQASREDVPPIIDEMRKVHDELRALEPPAECEVLGLLDTHMEAEMDQSIRGFVAFRSLELEDVFLGYLNESLFHSKTVDDLLLWLAPAQ